MIHVEKPSFLVAYVNEFGKPNQLQSDGLMFLIDKVGQDNNCWPIVQQLAYGLATFKWETGHTFQPVTEHGSHSYFDKYEPVTAIGKALGNTQTGDGYLFRGRGYVQLTGRGNYTKDGRLLGIDLVSDPDQALDHDTAYQIASMGMRDGWFTGRNLAKYIPEGGTPDYTNARQIINGMDHAADIAVLAKKFDAILTVSAAKADQAAPTESASADNSAEPSESAVEQNGVLAGG